MSVQIYNIYNYIYPHIRKRRKQQKQQKQQKQHTQKKWQTHLARVMATFNLLSSFKKPMPCLSLDLTQDKIITSFSLP